MEGWYVKQLLLNKDSIRENIYEEDHSRDRLDINLDDETYNDLLSVEVAFDKLYQLTLLNDKEYVVALLMMDSVRINDIATKLKIDRDSINPLFSSVCSKIAFYLGGHFTNEGFLQKMITKYNLNESQAEKILKIMEK